MKKESLKLKIPLNLQCLYYFINYIEKYIEASNEIIRCSAIFFGNKNFDVLLCMWQLVGHLLS
jgi:hypothetical protein